MTQQKLDYDKQIWNLNLNITNLNAMIKDTKNIVKKKEDEIKAQNEKLNGEIKHEHKLFTDEFEKNKQIPVLQIQLSNLKKQSAEEKDALKKDMNFKLDHEHDVEKNMEKNFNDKITSLNQQISKKQAELKEVQDRLGQAQNKVFNQNKEIEYQKSMITNYESKYLTTLDEGKVLKDKLYQEKDLNKRLSLNMQHNTIELNGAKKELENQKSLTKNVEAKNDNLEELLRNKDLELQEIQKKFEFDMKALQERYDSEEKVLQTTKKSLVDLETEEKEREDEIIELQKKLNVKMQLEQLAQAEEKDSKFFGDFEKSELA